MLRPRRAWIVQVVGTVLLLTLGLATHSVKGFGFESTALLLFGALMVLSLIVIAIRPPSIRLQQQAIVIERLGRSVVIDREHFLSFTFRRASRVVGGESTSSNRSLFISSRRDDGSVDVIPAFWSYRWLGLLSASEQAVAEESLNHWQSEMSATPAS